MAATSLSTPRLGSSLTSPALQTLRNYKFSITFLSFSYYAKSLISRDFFHSVSSPHRSRRLTTAIRAESTNGAEPPRQYDYDLFTVGAGSGGVRASRFAANFGAKVVVCELPFATISSDSTGGVGGTAKLILISKLLLVFNAWDEANEVLML